MDWSNQKLAIFWGSILSFIVLCIIGLFFGYPAYSRYQAVQYAENQTHLNEVQIYQTEQLVKVESQKAQIRVVEATGISEAQKIINVTLTDRYLQHEAIKAQEKMANSPNHTTVYIPSGQNGIPVIKTIDESK